MDITETWKLVLLMKVRGDNMVQEYKQYVESGHVRLDKNRVYETVSRNAGPIETAEFQPKERKRRTLIEQLNFNEERLHVLHKEIESLIQILSPIIVDEAIGGSEDHLKEDERNCEMMKLVLAQSYHINRMIFIVNALQRGIQL